MERRRRAKRPSAQYGVRDGHWRKANNGQKRRANAPLFFCPGGISRKEGPLICSTLCMHDARYARRCTRRFTTHLLLLSPSRARTNPGTRQAHAGDDGLTCHTVQRSLAFSLPLGSDVAETRKTKKTWAGRTMFRMARLGSLRVPRLAVMEGGMTSSVCHATQDPCYRERSLSVMDAAVGWPCGQTL